jgi:hypothetical protein
MYTLQTNLNEFQYQIRQLDRLRKIAHTIHRLDENACNYELSKRQETRLKNLLIEAEGIASNLGLKIYHQRDPRGKSLYLINEEMDETNYNHGMAI